MNAWSDENAGVVMPVLAGVAACLLLLAVLFLVLWLLSRRRARIVDDDRVETEWNRIDRELDLAEQQSRLRIVRELQDVALRSLGRAIDEADGARYAARTEPDAAVRALHRVTDRGRAAIADMRRVLTIAKEGETIVTSMPSLPSARDLVSVMREAGLDIEVSESGTRFPLRRGAELALFRTLQGCLENALKHGGTGTRVQVGFTWTDKGLTLAVDDDGIRAAARRRGLGPDAVNAETAYSVDEDLRSLTEAISGAGISEMRTRAEAFGGTLSAHPVPGVGFSVSVAFPTLRFHNGVHGVDLGR